MDALLVGGLRRWGSQRAAAVIARRAGRSPRAICRRQVGTGGADGFESGWMGVGGWARPGSRVRLDGSFVRGPGPQLRRVLGRDGIGHRPQSTGRRLRSRPKTRLGRAVAIGRSTGRAVVGETTDGDPRKRKNPGDDLFSRKAALSVSSALESLTSVFGMGTGVASPLESPGLYASGR
jgi:hypothetical protein